LILDLRTSGPRTEHYLQKAVFLVVDFEGVEVFDKGGFACAGWSAEDGRQSMLDAELEAMVVPGDIVGFDDDLMYFDIFGVVLVDGIDPLDPFIGEFVFLDLEQVVEKSQFLWEGNRLFLLALGYITSYQFLE